jgi:hypothetical protein
MYGKGPHGCPRGFEWCDKKQECIPEGSGVDKKLKLRAQRYFFKEDNTMKDIDKIVDEVFTGGFAYFGKVRKSEKTIDRLLDNVTTTGRPYDHPLKMNISPTPDGAVEVDVDECTGPLMDSEKGEFEGSDIGIGEQPAKNDNPHKISNDINHVPNQNVRSLSKSIHDELAESAILKVIEEVKKDSAYKEYFRKALKMHGYKSPADIPADKKAAFFNKIDRGWTAAHEKNEQVDLGEEVILKVVEEASENDDYKIFLSLALEESGYTSPSDIPEDKRIDFFSEIDRAWTKSKNKK